jgi:hypothetical protein
MVEKQEKKELKTIPGHTRGVQVNAALRTLKMGQPICPNSKVEMERLADGRWVQKPQPPGRENCQLAKGEWWIDCEKRGHKPYFSTTKWYVTEDILEEDEQGRLVKKGEQLIPHEETRPNIVQVAISIRHNSGRGAQKAIQKKGFVRLGDIGYYEVCQFRNCQAPVSSKVKSKNYGHYCSTQHLQLVCADVEGELLHVPNQTVNGQDYAKIVKMREKQLREAAVGALDA